MFIDVHCDCNHIVHSLALPHVRHATLLHVLLRFHTYVMLRCCTFFCASTHTSCYAAARSFALPHIRHAMLLHVLLRFHTYVMLRARTACYADGCKAWKRASKQQVPEKRLKWQNVARNCGEFVKHLDRKPTKKSSSLAGTQALDRQWGWLKNASPRQLHTHKDCRQDFKKNWKHLYAAVWRKSVKGNALNNLGQLCA